MEFVVSHVGRLSLRVFVLAIAFKAPLLWLSMALSPSLQAFWKGLKSSMSCYNGGINNASLDIGCCWLVLNGKKARQDGSVPLQQVAFWD